MCEWQDVETAPKDGTEIWMYFPHAMMGAMQSQARWQLSDLGHHRWLGHAEGYLGTPTHWMPLPDPPSS